MTAPWRNLRRVRLWTGLGAGIVLAGVGLAVLLGAWSAPREVAWAETPSMVATRAASARPGSVDSPGFGSPSPSSPVTRQATSEPLGHTLQRLGWKEHNVVLRPSTVRDGALTIPDRRGEAGVYWPSGEAGTGVGVIVGHVSWDGQPGTFSQLSRLRVGDILTTAAGATQQQWRVLSTTLHPRGRLPAKVFSPGSEQAIALVTCAGPLKNREFTRNLVVWAEPV